jgi:hypothetical protein
LLDPAMILLDGIGHAIWVLFVNEFHPRCNGGRGQKERIGRLFERPTLGGA